MKNLFVNQDFPAPVLVDIVLIDFQSSGVYTHRRGLVFFFILPAVGFLATGLSKPTYIPYFSLFLSIWRGIGDCKYVKTRQKAFDFFSGSIGG